MHCMSSKTLQMVQEPWVGCNCNAHINCNLNNNKIPNYGKLVQPIIKIANRFEQLEIDMLHYVG